MKTYLVPLCWPAGHVCSTVVYLPWWLGKRVWKSDSEVLPSSASVSNDLYLLLVGISESDLGGLLSLGLLIFFPLSGCLLGGALKLFVLLVEGCGEL